MISPPVYASGRKILKNQTMFSYSGRINIVDCMEPYPRYRKGKERGQCKKVFYDAVLILTCGILAGTGAGIIYIWARFFK